MADNSDPSPQADMGWSLEADLKELERRSERSGEEFDQAAVAVIERHPDEASGYCRIATLYDLRGETAKGLHVLDCGLQRMGGDLEMLKLGAVLSRYVPDFERAILYHRRWAELPGHRLSNMLAIARLSLSVLDGTGAWAAFEEAIAAGHSRDQLRLGFAHAALLKGDHQTCRSLIEEEKKVNGSSSITSIESKLATYESLARNRTSMPQKLGSGATAALKHWAKDRNAPTGIAEGFPEHFVTEEGDIVVERVRSSPSLVLAFGGALSMVSGAPPVLNPALERARINSVLLSDPQRLFMLAGIWSIGGYKDSIAWLRNLMAAWHISNLYCFGKSAAGYPAIRYGLDLGARRIMTFAAPTTLADGVGGRGSRGRAILGRLLKHVPEMCLDLRGEIARHGEAAPEIINYYGADMPRDAIHAHNIADLPTVQSRPLAGLASHNVGAHLKATDRHWPAFEEFLRDRK